MIDGRQAMIVYQNALSHATQIVMHNAKLKDEAIDVQAVLNVAKEIAREVIRLGTAADQKGK